MKFWWRNNVLSLVFVFPLPLPVVLILPLVGDLVRADDPIRVVVLHHTWQFAFISNANRTKVISKTKRTKTWFDLHWRLQRSQRRPTWGSRSQGWTLGQGWCAFIKKKDQIELHDFLFSGNLTERCPQSRREPCSPKESHLLRSGRALKSISSALFSCFFKWTCTDIWKVFARAISWENILIDSLFEKKHQVPVFDINDLYLGIW